MRGWAVRGAHVFALCGFAFAQPTLDVLGTNATFFVAHDTSPARILLFTAAVVLVPPALFCGVIALVSLVSRPLAKILFTSVVAALIGLTLASALQRSLDLATWSFAVVLVFVAAGAGYLYVRFDPMRQFVTWLSAAPFLFVGAFLFASPVNTLVFSGDPEARAEAVGVDTPIVMVVLDEMPLGVLLDERGAIDANRFPNFARLARESTWYPNGATVSQSTHLAVPAILTGARPVSDQEPPISPVYPKNLFTLLGRSHDLNVNEIITDLCPASVCERKRTDTSLSGTRTLAVDSLVVYSHAALPEGLTRALGVPALGATWGGFDRVPEKSLRGTAPADKDNKLFYNWDGLDASRTARFDQFIDSLGRNGKADKPTLDYLHVLLPHGPYTFLPDGRRYAAGVRGPAGLDEHLRWTDDPYPPVLGIQQLSLQSRFTDTKIGQLLDRLHETDRFDESMVVVVADHGAAFERNGALRAGPNAGKVARDELMPVPLFVKYPFQREGKVDRRRAQTIDILPTIADALQVDLPRGWAPDGRSLRAKHPRRHYIFGSEDNKIPVHGRPDARTAAALFHLAVPVSATHDGYRIGPYGDLVGQNTLEMIGPRVQSPRIGPLETVERPERSVAAEYTAPLVDARNDEWFAITVNGVVAGTGKVFTFNGESRLYAMVDPALLHDGPNDVRAFLIDPGSRLLRPVRPLG